MHRRERLVRRLRQAGIDDEQVLAAILHTPRHLFLDEALASHAYENLALPIGFGQALSQPYIVARMTRLLLGSPQPQPRHSVLEIGAGSGYQTAVLAALVERVYSIERIGGLLEPARDRLARLGFRNVRLRHGDGSHGWPEPGPFDGILVTAAAPVIPPDLLAQLTMGGCLVMPVGPPGKQRLWRVERTPAGFEESLLDRVSFVPLMAGLL